MRNAKTEVDRLLRGETTGVVPLHDSPWSDTLEKWATQGMPRTPAGTAVDPTEHFDFDIVNCGGWFDWFARIGHTEIVDESDDWKLVRNGNGAVLRWWKHKSGTPEHVDFHMTNRAIWDAEYRPFLGPETAADRVGDLSATVDALRRHQSRWTGFGHQFIWENLRASLGDVNMFVALSEDPEWIHDFNRVYTDLYKACYTILFERCGKPDGVWIYEDLGYKERLFCSPKMLADLIFPYYAEMVDFFHGHGLPVIFHSCGYQEPMIPLVVEAGFDGLNPMEVKAGNDILAYAERFGDDLCFVGGLDARVLETGDRTLIEREVVGLVRGMRERGARFVYGSDHSLSTNIDYEDFLFSLEVYRSVAYP